ncbi:MAG: GNAT family N-acetyltransferase [Syntrophomonadaceae bacterium]|nr:GNAT family N-acetyltransferase [Syntrophomonadaceae bacterium]
MADRPNIAGNRDSEIKDLIRRYIKEIDQEKVMQMLAEQSQEWECYSAAVVSGKYQTALESSITYVAYEGDFLCGYSRSLDDCGFYIYVCDLLVRPECRGRNIGRGLLQCVSIDYPGRTVYVMSDEDGYYQKLGFRKEGSVFEISSNS